MISQDDVKNLATVAFDGKKADVNNAPSQSKFEVTVNGDVITQFTYSFLAELENFFQEEPRLARDLLLAGMKQMDTKMEHIVLRNRLLELVVGTGPRGNVIYNVRVQ
tara:strand:- start:1809 stop:2129 length:321 start_codon:yes stop_codon:yes gene_type:complete